jgi:hypothetical protein
MNSKPFAMVGRLVCVPGGFVLLGRDRRGLAAVAFFLTQQHISHMLLGKRRTNAPVWRDDPR